MAPPPPPALPNFWLGTWSRPTDRPSQVALALGVALLVIALAPGGPRWLLSAFDVTGAGEVARRRRFLFVMSFVAAFLSLGYIAFYLRGGPRAPEAAAYWLQGRALSHGDLAWTAPDPTANFRGRDLLLTVPDRLAGILPPGFAVLLGMAFWLGAPMLVGPLLAAALVPATWLLGRELAASGLAGGADDPRTEWTGRLAAGLSLVSAALRYHTAESLPHGAAALALALALACALRGHRTARAPVFALAGLAAGLLLATEPLAAVGAGAVVLLLALRSRERGRSLGYACAAAAPGVLLLLAANRAALGHAFASPLAYYLARFAPADAFGPKAAALAALRRVRANLADVANLEPLALLPLLLLRPSARRARRESGGAVPSALALVVLQVFVLGPTAGADATPGAGAAALANLLPVEHALVALALVLSFPGRALGPAATATLGLALAGFALHVSHDHQRLAADGLGRPRFEPDIAREAGATHGLLFFDDDEAYELAHDPGVTASHGLLAARLRNDDHDRLLFDLLGHPQAHRYVLGHSVSSVSAWSAGAGDVWRFEAEADYPPVTVPDPRAGRVEVIEGSCASDGRALALTPAGAAKATMTLELPVPRGTAAAAKRAWLVIPRVLLQGGAGTADLALVTDLGGPALATPLAQWTWADAARMPICNDLPGKTVELGGEHTHAWLVVTARGGSVALDKTTLRGH
ncbi:MAG TPA: hypothetical protein VH044_07210 [Polyangiaceae bacterium]|jgi:hypothetical protein|nr:hypothetical protein [Polyangiaceae bacterium]